MHGLGKWALASLLVLVSCSQATERDGGDEEDAAGTRPDVPGVVKPIPDAGSCTEDEECSSLGVELPPCGVARCLDEVCVIATVEEGTSCNDGQSCTVDDRCDAGGTCAGRGMDCDDEDPCTDDTCLDGGCLHIPGVAPCDDGDPCTVRDACSGGACAGEPRDCDDGEECTYDVCSGEAGCTYTPVEGPCDDEDLCTEENTCDEGACVGVAVECDDLNACTQSSCDPAVGCVHTVVAGACDDGERCTEGDACSHGVCMPGSWDEALEGCERGSCGNRICANDESCLSCPADCGPCCGDGACVAAFGESCGTCAIDCALCPGCANGACEPELGEDCETCAQDCGPCADACLPISTVACGQTVKDSLNSGETTDVIGSYACDEVAGVNHIGPERAFILGAACDGVVRVNLRRTGGQGGLLDLVVLDGWRPCRGQACVAAGVMDSPEQDRGVAELRFLGWSQHPYLVVVDGAVGATGDFELNITCSCSIPAEVCSGGEDEDADGRTDCEDPECAASPPCTGVEPDCGDGRDEDMDGKTDCEDPDCAEAEGCE